MNLDLRILASSRRPVSQVIRGPETQGQVTLLGQCRDQCDPKREARGIARIARTSTHSRIDHDELPFRLDEDVLTAHAEQREGPRRGLAQMPAVNGASIRESAA